MFMKKFMVLSLLVVMSTSFVAGNYIYAQNNSSKVLSSDSKYVTVKIHYDMNYYDIGDYWYSDGVYSGWLYKREADITGSFTAGYDVVYKGYVLKGPFVPNKVDTEELK